jgi:hypothetical protein
MPAVAVTAVGAMGAPTTIAGLGCDARPLVKTVRAATLNVKVVPLVSPVRVSVVAAELKTRGACATAPANGVTV